MVVRCRAISSVNFDAVVPFWLAIACKASQNSFSSDTLVFCPLMKIDRLLFAVFVFMASIRRDWPSGCVPVCSVAGTGNLELHQLTGLDFRV